MLKYKILIKLYALSCLLTCCVYGDIIQAEVVVFLCLVLEVLSNIYFKEQLPEDGQNRLPKHVGGCAVYNTVNLYMHFWVVFLIMTY
jgi:hypothetical protein